MTLAMEWTEWASYDGLGLAGLVREGKLSAAELANQAREAVRKVDGQLNAVVEVFHDAVENPAVDGLNADGVFTGLPFFMKDLGPTLKGRLQEFGSSFMKGHRPTADAWLTSQMRKAGLNLIGRTTTPEFGVCSSAENPAIYVTHNPWNTDYPTFGSSAGTAAVVAAGVVPISHGTDGGGSIRIPAGFTGSIGLKPSRGVLSIAPALSDISGYVSTQGCLSRTVRDTAAFIDACRGGAPGEFMPYWTAPQPYSQLISKDPAKLKIALSHEWGDYAATPHIVQELEKAAKFLESLGHTVEWVKPEVDFRAAFHAQTVCYISNFAQVFESLLTDRDLTHPPETLIEPMNIRLWEVGRNVSYSERHKMICTLNTVSRALGNFLSEWDVILTPITSLSTPAIGMTDYLTIADNPDVWDWFDNLWRFFAYTPLSNLTGTPAISLPMAMQENGLPFGIQAISRQANDGLLLQLASQIERALNGRWNAGRTPVVHVTR